MPSSDINKHSNNLKPIGIFDSGVGGLSIFNCVAEQLPNENLIYIADTLHAPYGDKSDEAIIERVNIIADKLIALNCKAIVVACNTATVIAIDQLRLRISLPIIGVEPAIKPAALLSKNKRIAILTTQATAKNKRFLALVNKFKQNALVHIQPCPGLVELIEGNQLHSPKFIALLRNYLSEIQDLNIDTIVLGCTHYPFFADQIQSIITSNITLMETATPVTEQLKRQLNNHHLLNSSVSSGMAVTSHQFFSSNKSDSLEKIMRSLTNSQLSLLPM